MLRTIGSYLGFAAGNELASNPRLLNIAATKFDPQNPGHLMFIDERLQHFAAKRDALLSLDYKMKWAIGIDSAVWLSGFTGGWGPYLAVAGYVAIYLSAQQYGRDTLKKEFQDALKEIYSIYHWYTKDQGPAVTCQPRFQELFSALIPFTQDCQQLIFWDLKRLGQNDIAYRVIEILEQSPHKAVAGVLKLDAKAPKLNEPTAPIIAVPDPKAWVSQNRPYQFFAETAANAKLIVYGCDFEKEMKETPQPRRG